MTIPGKEKAIKRYRRARFWDYKRGASLFITIAIERSSTVFTCKSESENGCARFAPASEDGCAVRNLFGQVVDGKMVLTPLGRIVAEALDSITRYNPGVIVFGRVVMPDHVHFNVNLAPGLDEPLKTLGKAITRFKNFTIKQSKLLAERSSAIFTANCPTALSEDGCGALSEDGRAVPGCAPKSEDGCAARSLHWQQGYHDRLCLSRDFIDSTERYIAYNPLKWQLMYQTPGALAVHEPLDSPRLDPVDYWKGVGNTALLSPKEKIVSLRISRRLSPAQLDAALARISRAVDQGFVILSGFVSPGEKRMRDMLCARKDARFIRILPSSIPNRRFKPESRYVGAFLENRYLEIARGNEEIEFSRATCLDYNAEIVEIANAVEGGFALYFKPEGLVRLSVAGNAPQNS